MRKIFMFLILILFVAMGSGAIAGDRDLTFQWEYADPVGQGVTHFRIYKSLVSGTYILADIDRLAEIEFTGESGVYETDATLTSPDGQAVMWYFIATAWDGQMESGLSNEVSQLIDFEAPGDVFNFTVTIKVTTP
jgi:hypothetical protein